MCGIAGYLSSHGSISQEVLKKMADSLSHRGPDGSGVYIDRNIGLAHRRLAILGLGAQGAQPMTSFDLRYVITFNGEIYNHLAVRSRLATVRAIEWKGQSDTETLVNAIAILGFDEAIREIQGMFAFALWDSREKALILARDRAGEKPLYYWKGGGSVIFGSEIKALFAHPECPRKISHSSLRSYFEKGWNSLGESIIKNIERVAPGTYLMFDCYGREVKRERFWNISSVFESGMSCDESLINKIESELEKAVRSQSVADVPIGVLLSGGIDSSLITAMMAKVGGNFRTFTICNRNAPEIDETRYARLVADHFGTKHTEIDASEIVPDDFVRLAYFCDEPLADTSLLPSLLVSESVKKHCSVAIGGDGGDELFGGYTRHSWVVRASARNAPMRAAYAFLEKTVRSSFPLSDRFIRATTRRIGSPQTLLCHGYIQDTRKSLSRFINTDLFTLQSDSHNTDFMGQYDSNRSALFNALSIDFNTYLPDDLLMKMDRSSMAAGLEMRAPFLSSNMIDLAFTSVPDRLKNNGKQRKIALAMICQRLLPKSFLTNRKQGFSISQKRLFDNKAFLDLFRQVISESPDNFLRKDKLLKVLYEKTNHIDVSLVLKIVIFELWRRQWNPSLP